MRKSGENIVYFTHWNKPSNKATFLLRSLLKCSFTLSKLRYFELRRPKISTCYTTRRVGRSTE